MVVFVVGLFLFMLPYLSDKIRNTVEFIYYYAIFLMIAFSIIIFLMGGAKK